MSLTTEIQQFQDEAREGWMPEKKADPAAKIMSTPRPTPETDQAWAKWPYAGPGVHANFARKLERERDELAAKLVANEAYQAGLLAERDESREQLENILNVVPADASCLHAETGETVTDYILDLQKEVGRVHALYFNGKQQLEAMREAIRVAHACLNARASELIESALAKLQPFIKP